MVSGDAFPHAFSELIQSSNPHSEWMYCGGIENAPDLVQQIADRRKLLGCDSTILRTVRDPVQVATCLCDAELPFAPVRTANTQIGTSTDATNPRWLLKPLASCAGHGIQPFSSSDLKADETGKIPPDSYLQHFVEGELQSGTFVANGTSATWLGTTRGFTLSDILPTHSAAAENPFGYAGSTGPLELSIETRKRWQQISDALTRRFRLVGLFGVDAIAKPSGDIVPIEINPRYTASMELIELATRQSLPGRSLIEMHLDACQSRVIPGRSNANATAAIRGCKQIIYARDALLFSENEFRDFVENWKRAYPHAEFSDLPNFDSDNSSHQFAIGQPIMTVFTASDCLVKEPATLQNDAKDGILS